MPAGADKAGADTDFTLLEALAGGFGLFADIFVLGAFCIVIFASTVLIFLFANGFAIDALFFFFDANRTRFPFGADIDFSATDAFTSGADAEVAALFPLGANGFTLDANICPLGAKLGFDGLFAVALGFGAFGVVIFASAIGVAFFTNGYAFGAVGAPLAAELDFAGLDTTLDGLGALLFFGFADAEAAAFGQTRKHACGLNLGKQALGLGGGGEGNQGEGSEQSEELLHMELLCIV